MRVRISWPGGSAEGELNDSSTALAVSAALPITSRANTWGDEVYFSAPVQSQLDETPRQVVPAGTICFWVQGGSIAVPFGPTPISVGRESRLVTAVNVNGSISGDPRVLESVKDGDAITLERLDG